jgi:hypothetical protein
MVQKLRDGDLEWHDLKASFEEIQNRDRVLMVTIWPGTEE